MPARSRRLLRPARSVRRCLSIAVSPLLVWTPARVVAQALDSTPANATPGAAAPSGHAAAAMAVAARAAGRLSVDGRLDEAAWRTATPITTFTQVDPVEGAPASLPTEVRIVFDDDAVYIGATMRDDHPVSLRVARRDAQFLDSDVFAVALDSYHDHQTAFRFAVNASGVKRDEVITSTGGGDTSWDPVWQAATRVDSSGWVAELRIPYSQLRFGRDVMQTWGIQLERRIARTQEHAVFAFTPKTQRGGPPRFNHLTGIGHASGAHRLELLPYTYGRASYRAIPTNPSVAFANPYRSGSDYVGGVGTDLKYRLTSNFTVDATVNPDFGQVEVDPALINLSAYETRYEEKRPFFVEGAEIFRFGSSLARESQLIYSRRIGRAPQGAVPSDAAYADVPETATILGAAKLTGKTANGWSAGLLEAVTGRATARYVDTTNVGHRAEVEPATSYFAGRVRHSTPSGGTSFGALATAVRRRLGDEALAERLRAAAYVGGVDFRHEWGNRDYSVSAQIASSLVLGRPGVITSAQRSSARYFQRPDATYLGVDSSATRMAGYSSFLAVGKFAGRWQRTLTLSATSPSFEINDMGFQSTADRLGVDMDVSYHETNPGRVWRRWEASVSPDATWNYGGDRVGGGVSARVGGTLLNYWSVNANWSARAASLDDRLTRGGPVARSPRSQSLGGWLSSNPRSPVTLNASAHRGWSEAGGWSQHLGVSVGLKPASSVELQVGPDFGRSRSVSQYVTSVDDATAAATYGRRYVFATLDQTTLSMDTRLNVAFSPTLTLEMYAQPFVSTGDYGALKQLRAPRTRAFDVYGVDAGAASRDSLGIYTIDPDAAGPAPSFTVGDRDFSFRSLRGNAVLRWEWHAGSTLFLVWQQNRALTTSATRDPTDDRVGRFDPYRDARELFSLRPDNVLQVKLTYWLNP